MRQSQGFAKTTKTALKDDVSTNARLLEQGGFVYKNSAGIYTYLPLGWRVMQKIAQIIREEMNAIGGQEMFLPILHDKHYLQATGRWDVDVVFKVVEGKDQEPSFNISWTAEELFAEIATRYLNSYKDLPVAAYQINAKFRNEPRAKSGLLRGREFMMKDLYSFHATEDDFNTYYHKVGEAYTKIFNRCGLDSIYTLAAGGEFTASNTHEFQVIAPVGEDTIYVCEKCRYAENSEIATVKAGDKCPKCSGTVGEHKSIEVGNIFPLGTKYSEAFDLKFTNASGEKKFVIMGSYGIGLGRVMGTIVEVFNDDKGILWPQALAPFKVHLVALPGKDASVVMKKSDQIYADLQAANVEVLYDDRVDASAGEKFADSDLVGLPYRVVVSAKTLAEDSVELKKRSEANAKLISLGQLIAHL
jgi:prolyl-tRNA synthetase